MRMIQDDVEKVSTRMARFSMLTDEELDFIESASYNEDPMYLADEIHSANELEMQNAARRKSAVEKVRTRDENTERNC